ncbi:MAG: DMT family transporter [Deltaproteobacteria bacterium]|nr:DMT family transporter [Deltaproteobacteria bacterium]
MAWLLLALTAALATAVVDTLSKKFFSDLTAFEMGLIRLVYALPCLVAGFVLIPRPELDAVFWTCIAVGLPLEVTALLCYMRAIKVSPLSLTVPFLAFTPAFVILTGYLFLGETLSLQGILGIALVVVGSYVLNLSHARERWLAPIFAVFREQGSWLMLLTSFIFSFTATLGKVAILHSSPPFFGVTYFLCVLGLMLLISPAVPGVRAAHLFLRPGPAMIIGLSTAVMVFSHTYAISLVEAAYMLSIKRTSLLFGVILGGLVFREVRIRERLLGAFIMLTGVFLIALSP